MKYFIRLRHWYLKRALWIRIVLPLSFVVASGAYVASSGSPELKQETYTLERTNLSEEVSVTGRVEASERVDLGFEKGGKVARVSAVVGRYVPQGAVLAALSNADLAAEVERARADVKAEEARYEELVRGSRPEDIAIKEVSVLNARRKVSESEDALAETIRNVFTTADDSVRNKLDQFILNPKSQHPELSFVIADQELRSQISGDRYIVENSLNEWAKRIASGVTVSNVQMETVFAAESLRTIRSLFDRAGLAVNSLAAGGSLSQTTIDSYKASLATARTNVNLAIESLLDARDLYAARTSDYQIAEKELALLKAGNTSEQVRAGEAALLSARARLSSAEAEYAKTIIRAPFGGVVTLSDFRVGQIVSANDARIAMVSEVTYQMNAYVPEADISRLRVSMPARVTLDAYGDDELFPATISVVYPAETLIDGVATYKVVLNFDEQDVRIKSGMTANITVTTEVRDNALAIPGRFVSSENGKRYVDVLVGDPGTIERREIVTGIRNLDGRLEVVSGLLEGEVVAVTR